MQLVFIVDNNLLDVFVSDNGELPKRNHTLIALMINNYQFITVNQTHELIHKFSKYADQYLYVAVNKFLVYTDVDNLSSNTNLDVNLIDYWTLPNFELVYKNYIANDIGMSGNFIHPVTEKIGRAHV